MTLQVKIMLGVAALVVALLVGFALVNASLRVALAESQTQVMALKAGHENLKAGIAQQNAALAAMREDSDSRARKAEALVAEGRRKALALRREAARIAARFPASPDDCAAARDLMTGYVEARKRAAESEGRP